MSCLRSTSRLFWIAGFGPASSGPLLVHLVRHGRAVGEEVNFLAATLEAVILDHHDRLGGAPVARHLRAEAVEVLAFEFLARILFLEFLDRHRLADECRLSVRAVGMDVLAEVYRERVRHRPDE
jgi:hypothetical protein